MIETKEAMFRPEPTVPAVFVLHLASAIRACGVDDAGFLAQTGSSLETLSDPALRISYARFSELARAAAIVAGEPGLGFILGATAPISRFGSLGFAVFASATLADALRIVERYMSIVTNICRYKLQIEEEQAVLELEERVPLGSARELVVTSVSTAVWRLGEQLTGVTLPADVVEFGFDEPEYFARFAAFAPGMRFRFGAVGHRVRFARRFLELPIVSADPAAARSALAQCERELSALAARPTLIEEITELLERCSTVDDWPTPKQLAKRLGLAERTFKRRLAQHETSYSLLVDSVRKRRAVAALRAQRSIDDIASELGYSDAANFTRAFRRWTGKNPSAYRRAEDV